MDSPPSCIPCRFRSLSITEIYRNEFQWEILLPRYGAELAICVVRHGLKHIGQSLWIGFNCPLNCAGYSQRCKSNMGSILTAREPRSTSANQQLCRAQPPERFRISGARIDTTRGVFENAWLASLKESVKALPIIHSRLQPAISL